MKLLVSVVSALLLTGCASPDTAILAEDYSRKCRQIAHEMSLHGTPDNQGYYQICMRSQGYGVLSRIKSSLATPTQVDASPEGVD